MRRRRHGSGALLAFCAIGIIVMSIMVFTQGYLAGALGQTDAVLAGRQAEYLADGALAEALLRLQESRNTEFAGLFQAGSSFAVDPDLTASLALPGMSVDTVLFSKGASQDFHGDGRGFFGTISIEATVGVPRRVARAAGISTYRTVRHDFEYKGVLQGPPAEYADKMLFAREMRGLPEMKLWYEEDLQDAWDEVRQDTDDAVREDAQEVADSFGDFVDFAGDAADLLGRMLDWPASISGIGAAGVTEIVYDIPDIDVEPQDLPGLVAGVVDAVADPQVVDLKVKLDGNGDYYFDAQVCAPVLGCHGPKGWTYDADFLPSVKDVVVVVLEDSIEKAIEEVLPGLTAYEARSQLEQISMVDTSQFMDIIDGGDYPLPELVRDSDWPPFRTDAEPLGEPAYVLGARGTVTHDELLLHPPDVPPQYPDSPLNDPAFDVVRSFDPFVWRDLLINESPPLASLQLPFAVYPGEWRAWFDPYFEAWDTELRRLEEVISLGEQPDANLMTPEYWATMAAYEFPDPGTGLAYIQSRWGRAGAVYRFTGGGDVQLGGLNGHGTFTTMGGGDLGVGGAGTGSHTVVAGQVTVNGSARAAIFSSDEPVLFDGASVTGVVAAAGLKNVGRDELDPFTITHDPMEGDLTFSVCEYPVSVVVERE